MPRTPDPKSKASFVRSFPPSTPANEIVSKAKSKGIKLDVRYVYSIRTAAKAKAKTKRSAVTPAAGAAAPAVKRGRGRPRKSAMDGHNLGSARTHGASPGGLVAEIERIVEAKVAELLKSRLGALLG